jgi:phosphohistidine phosphatase
MQRRLLLIRHAQAANAPLDRDRPLTDDGAGRAEAIGAWLAESGLVPDRVLVSPALRARQTWERASVALDAGGEPDADQRIYDNTVDDLLAVISEVPDEVGTLAVVGHNPSIGALAAELADGAGAAAAQQQVDVGFRAGGVAVFDLPGPFSTIGPGQATLSDYRVP